MAYRGWLLTRVVSFVCCLCFTGCRDGGGPTTPDPLELAVRVVLDSATFRSRGEFALDLVPSDRTGTSFVAEQWGVSVGLSTPVSVSLGTVSQSHLPADTTPVASAILIDDSGSMRFSDPERRRATAAALFWGELLDARSRNVVALLDFGRGDVGPTPGFERTTLLADFTSDRGVLEAVLGQVQAMPGGGTPLYTSAREVIAWMDSTRPGAFQRSLVVITDGEPSDLQIADSLFASAAGHQVRIFAVGVGDAAEPDAGTAAARLVQELATRTGGIYAAADSAIELQAILLTLAKSASPDRFLVYLHLDPPPASNVTVRGTVTVSGERGSASAPWSFISP